MRGSLQRNRISRERTPCHNKFSGRSRANDSRGGGGEDKGKVPSKRREKCRKLNEKRGRGGGVGSVTVTLIDGVSSDAISSIARLLLVPSIFSLRFGAGVGKKSAKGQSSVLGAVIFLSGERRGRTRCALPSAGETTFHLLRRETRFELNGRNKTLSSEIGAEPSRAESGMEAKKKKRKRNEGKDA